MLMKEKVKNKFYDRLHHGTVKVCMAVTAIGTVFLVYSGYLYYTQIKPQRQLEQLKKIQQGTVAPNTSTDTAKTITT